jgi:polyisoprenoid-binding protein YceI
MLHRAIQLVAVILITIPLFTACGLLQEPATPSAPIEAIPLEGEDSEASALATPALGNRADEMEATAVPLPTVETAGQQGYPADEQAVETPVTAGEAYPAVEQPTAEPAITQEGYPAGEGTAESDPAAAGGAAIYLIDPAASQVRFELDEELRGVPTTVVGSTDQVAGELAVNLADLSTTQVGVLQINARTLLTDNNFRNRAIQNQILETNEFEFITFTPTAVNGLPASTQVGETVQFSIAGELTIRDITQPVEFSVEATPMTESQLAGTASTIINRVDFELNIPSAPGVANVEEEVELYIDFVANS